MIFLVWKIPFAAPFELDAIFNENSQCLRSDTIWMCLLVVERDQYHVTAEKIMLKFHKVDENISDSLKPFCLQAKTDWC